MDLVVLVVAFVPTLLAARGLATADTKDYLYIDPGRLTKTAPLMWDPNSALGTVTHENIGYLFPMGPFFWLARTLGVPMWVSERLWLGLLLAGAGLGILYLARTIGLPRSGQPVAALAYMLSPYFLQYAGRISVILMPWAGLPIMLALTIKAIRYGGWKYPAAFGLVVCAIGGINATALIYAGLAPVLWFPYAIWGTKEVPLRSAARAFFRIGTTTIVVSLWWISGLWVEARYGIDVLRYTETVPAVAQTSVASEVLRGLGYWYFYGSDALGPWVPAAVYYTQWIWLIAASYVVPVLAFTSAILLRWRHRAYFVLLMLVGLAISVGAHPFGHSSIFGNAFGEFMTSSEWGMALRSTDRATPLVIMSTAMLLGAGAAALYHRFHPAGITAVGIVAGLIVVANPGLLYGWFIPTTYERSDHLPSYYHQAAAYLNSKGTSTRVWGVPGVNFASETWGDAIDPVFPGLLNRPYVQRQQQIYGSIPTQDLLYAVDEPFQQDTLEPSTLAPIARLMSAGDIALISDYLFARYNTPRPQEAWGEFVPTPKGLGKPKTFGAIRPDLSTVPFLDEEVLTEPANAPWPAPITVFPVKDPRPIIRAESSKGAIILDGDGSGLVAASAVGLLHGNPNIVYAGTFAKDPSLLRSLAKQGATLVLTDSNRKRGFRWDTLRENAGYTKTASQPAASPSDYTSAPIKMFPGAPEDTYTVTQDEHIASVSASSYGNPVTFTPEDRPAMAIDGDLNTAWVTGAFTDPVGQWWQVRFDHPITASSITLTQPLTGNPNRWITRATLSFDGKRPVTITLGRRSRTRAGQKFTFPARTFSMLRITIDAVNRPHDPANQGLSAVGFAEVNVNNITANVITVPPQDMLRALGSASLNNRLVIILSRETAEPFPPRAQPERYMERKIWLPTARTFTLSGAAKISTLIPDNQIDQLLGTPGSDGSGIVANSSGRLPGDLRARAASALSTNPRSFWSPGFGYKAQVGAWLQYDFPHPVSFDHLNLALIADGRHSVPTELKISTGHSEVQVAVPAVSDSPVQNATVEDHLAFPMVTGRHVRFTIEAIRAEKTTDYYSHLPITLPVGIAKIGIPGVHMPAVPKDLPGKCQSNLIKIDGKPVDVRIVGTTARAQSLKDLSIVPCGNDLHGITLGPGYHLVTTADGHSTGFGIDRLVLDSAAGGGPAPGASRTTGTLPPPVPGPSPKVRVLSQSATGATVSVTGADHPFWFVLGESLNSGWVATLDGHSLGHSQLVDGFANGWYIDPRGSTRSTMTITLTWTPQRAVWISVVISGAALAFCLVLALWPRRRRGHRAPRYPKAAYSSLDELQALRSSALRSLSKARYGDSRYPTHTMIEEAEDAGPRLTSPFITDNLALLNTRSPWIYILVPFTGAAISSLVLSPLAGLAIGMAALVALKTRHGRAVLTAGVFATVTAAAIYVVVGQAVSPHLPGGSWPAHQNFAGTLTWFATCLLATDVLIEIGIAWIGRKSLRKLSNGP